MRSELSPRQRETLRLIAGGYTDAEIADALHVGITTAYRHVSDVRIKLGARNRAQAVDAGHRAGLLP